MPKLFVPRPTTETSGPPEPSARVRILATLPGSGPAVPQSGTLPVPREAASRTAERAAQSHFRSQVGYVQNFLRSWHEAGTGSVPTVTREPPAAGANVRPSVSSSDGSGRRRAPVGR